MITPTDFRAGRHRARAIEGYRLGEPDPKRLVECAQSPRRLAGGVRGPHETVSLKGVESDISLDPPHRLD
jgi:hypothetical protein